MNGLKLVVADRIRELREELKYLQDEYNACSDSKKPSKIKNRISLIQDTLRINIEYYDVLENENNGFLQ